MSRRGLSNCQMFWHDDVYSFPESWVEAQAEHLHGLNAKKTRFDNFVDFWQPFLVVIEIKTRTHQAPTSQVAGLCLLWPHPGYTTWFLKFGRWKQYIHRSYTLLPIQELKRSVHHQVPTFKWPYCHSLPGCQKVNVNMLVNIISKSRNWWCTTGFRGHIYRLGPIPKNAIPNPGRLLQPQRSWNHWSTGIPVKY